MRSFGDHPSGKVAAPVEGAFATNFNWNNIFLSFISFNNLTYRVEGQMVGIAT